MTNALPRHLGGSPPVRRFPVLPRPVDSAVALPADTVRALRLVAAELRDMPTECIHDREERLLWLGRCARRIEAAIAVKAHAPVAAPVVAPRPVEVPPVQVAPESPPPAPPAAAPRGQASRSVCDFAQTRDPGPDNPHRSERPPLRPLPARSAPATHWRPRQVDPALRRRVEAAGQLALSV